MLSMIRLNGIGAAALLTFALALPTAQPAAARDDAGQTAQGESNSRDGKVCRREKRMGSNRIEVFCVSKEQAEANRVHAQEEMRRNTDNTRR